MSEIKAIIMDVDGTLFSNSKEITSKTKSALLKAQSAGIKLILASGRPTSGLYKIGKELEMDKHRGYFISYNGSKVVDFETMETLFNEPIPIEEGKAILEHIKKFDVYPMIDKDDYMYVNDVFAKPIKWDGISFNIIEYEARGGGFLLCEQKDMAEFLDFEANKILTAGDPIYLQEHHKEMMKPFEERLTCMFTAPYFFEYTKKGIDKAKALDSVLKPMGITQDEMIGFGDGMNDISMIRYTGIGVAMGNAVSALKDIATYVTASNNDDGIAVALHKYMPTIIADV